MSPTVDGKFLHCGGERFWVKGVAYGTFAPTAEGGQFPSRERVADDFAMMARHGVNTVRTYTVRLQKIRTHKPLLLAEAFHLRGVSISPHHSPLDGL